LSRKKKVGCFCYGSKSPVLTIFVTFKVCQRLHNITGNIIGNKHCSNQQSAGDYREELLLLVAAFSEFVQSYRQNNHHVLDVSQLQGRIKCWIFLLTLHSPKKTKKNQQNNQCRYWYYCSFSSFFPQKGAEYLRPTLPFPISLACCFAQSTSEKCRPKISTRPPEHWAFGEEKHWCCSAFWVIK